MIRVYIHVMIVYVILLSNCGEFLISAVMAIINCVSVRWTARLMAVFTFFKIFAGIFVIILGIVHLSLKGIINNRED